MTFDTDIRQGLNETYHTNITKLHEHLSFFGSSEGESSSDDPSTPPCQNNDERVEIIWYYRVVFLYHHFSKMMSHTWFSTTKLSSWCKYDHSFSLAVCCILRSLVFRCLLLPLLCETFLLQIIIHNTQSNPAPVYIIILLQPQGGGANILILWTESDLRSQRVGRGWEVCIRQLLRVWLQCKTNDKGRMFCASYSFIICM